MRDALVAQSYEPDLILDGMHKFDDPEGRSCKDHTGYHHQILKGIALSHGFIDFVNTNKRLILEPKVASAYYAATRYETEKRIFIWCRSGRHRSVALTVLLKAVLEHDGFVVEKLNLSKSWQYICGGPQWCNVCAEGDIAEAASRVAQIVWECVPG